MTDTSADVVWVAPGRLAAPWFVKIYDRQCEREFTLIRQESEEICVQKPGCKSMQIGGVDTYVATPDKTKSNGHVLLFFPNAFGLHINDFLTMDAFAACGYLTLGVDYFAGV